MANSRDYTKPNSKTTAVKDAYSDLDIMFTSHPVTNDITVKKDTDAIKRAVRNILLTNHYERPFRPNFGGNLRGQLFELDTVGAGRRIKNRLEKVLKIYEPRIFNIQVEVSDVQRNNLDVRVFYSIKNGLPGQQVDFTVSRVR
jgi:phage baseplate assembly protein W